MNKYSYLEYYKRCGDDCEIVKQYLDDDWEEVWNILKRKEKEDGCKYELIWFEKITKDEYENAINKILTKKCS